MTLVANARMYAVNATVAALWRNVLQWVGAHAAVELAIVDHAAPALLADLWRRGDLAAVAMCGYPLATWDGDMRPVPLAAPAPTRFGAPVYASDIVVRTDSRFERDDDLVGTRFGWTLVDSQSGYQAPRRHFAVAAIAHGGRFFASTVGPLVTPRNVVDAIVDGTVDAGPLDGYWHALLSRYEQRTAAQLRVVATTMTTPIPCFVAAASVPAALRERLATAFVDAGSARGLRDSLAALELRGFERVDAAAYDALAVHARETDKLGYPELR